MSEPGQFNQAQARTMWRALSSLGVDVADQILQLTGAGREEDQVFLNSVRDTVDTALLHVRDAAEARDEDSEISLSPESRREAIIENAVTAAELVILEGSDGTNEETDYLTGSVAVAFVRKSHGRLADTLLHTDLTNRGSQTAKM